MVHTILADGLVAREIAVWLIPVVAAGALLTWLMLTRHSSHGPTRHREHTDQLTYRGPVEGGFYRYSPGMYSHSLSPLKSKDGEPPPE